MNYSRIFWDTNFKKIDFKKQADFVITRILEYGHLDDIKWLLKKYKLSQINKAVCQSPNLSEKTAIFWSLYLKIPQDKILCLKKSYQKKRKKFWPY